MSSEEDEDEILAGLILIGFSPLIAAQLSQSIVTAPQKNIQLINELKKSEPNRSQVLNEISQDSKLEEISKGKKPITQSESGMVNVLVSAGFTTALAASIVSALGNEDEVQRLVDANKRPVIFTTRKDSKVDDKICLPLEGEVFDLNDPQRPRIPINTHPNCRCNYVDAVTGQDLGQI